MNKGELKTFVGALQPDSKRKQAEKIFSYFDKLGQGQTQAEPPYHDYLEKDLALDVAGALHRILVACNDETCARFAKSLSYNGGSFFSNSGTTTASRNRLRYYQLCKAISTPDYKKNIDTLVVDEPALQKRAQPNTNEYKDLFKDLPRYLDDSRTLRTIGQPSDSFSKPDRRTIAWYTDQAMLMEAYRKSSGDPLLQQRLALVLLNSFAKASHATDNMNDLREYYENPIFTQGHFTGTVYFRESHNPLLRNCENALATKLGVNSKHLQFIHNPTYSDVIRRTFPYHDIKLAVKDLPAFERTCKAICAKVICLQPTLPTKLFVIDISEWLKDPAIRKDDANPSKTLLEHFYNIYKAVDAKVPPASSVDKGAFLGENDNKLKIIEKIASQLERYFLSLVKRSYDTATSKMKPEDKQKVIENIGVLFEGICLGACVSYKPLTIIPDSLSKALDNAQPPVETHPCQPCPRKQKAEGVYNKVKPYLEIVKVNPSQAADGVDLQLIFTPTFLGAKESNKEKLQKIWGGKIDDGIFSSIWRRSKELRTHSYHLSREDPGDKGKEDCLAKMIGHSIVNTGYRPNPSHSKEMWMGLEGLDSILANAGIAYAEFATPGTTPTVCSSFSEFLNQPVVATFRNLKSFSPPLFNLNDREFERRSNESLKDFQKRLKKRPAPPRAPSVGHKYPYLNVYPEAMVALLEGLREYKFTPRDQVVKLRAYIRETDSEHPFTGTGQIQFDSDASCVKTVYTHEDCKEDHKKADPITADSLREGFEFYVKLQRHRPAKKKQPPEQEPAFAKQPAPAKYDLKLALTLSDADKQVETVKEGAKEIAYTRVQIDEFELDKNSTILFEGSDIDMEFGAKGLKDLLQTIYYRLFIAMRTAIDQRENFLQFLEQIELIHQEISALLLLLMPYKPEDFPKAIEKAMCEGTIEDYPGLKGKRDATIAKDRLKPKASSGAPMIHFRSSAMHCLSSIVSGTEEQKHVFAETDKAHINLVDKGLKICVLRDSYYEELAAAQDWPMYSVLTFDSDYLCLEANGINGIVDLPANAPDPKPERNRVILTDASLAPQNTFGNDSQILRCDHIHKGLLKKDARGPTPYKVSKRYVPIDIFICDFHHNISGDRTHYKPEDLIRHVQLLHRKGLFADRFTVAVDNTIGFVCEPDVKAFIEDAGIRKLMDKGKLNLVIFRSGQKFEQLGMDNFYGGYSITINDNSWGPFNARMNRPEDELQGINRQGHTHLSMHAAKWLDVYRKLIMGNHSFLRSKIAKGMLDAKTGMIMKTEDPYSVFMDIRGHPEQDNAGEWLQSILTKMGIFAGIHKLDWTKRPSFGFATTNQVTIFPGKNFRATFGLAGKATMLKWADFFNGYYHWGWGSGNESIPPMPSAPSDESYIGHIGKLYGALPKPMKDETTQSPMKVKLSTDSNDGRVILEITFPGLTRSKKVPPLNTTRQLRMQVKALLKQLAREKGITCSIRALSETYEKSLEVPHGEEPKEPMVRLSPGFEIDAIEPKEPAYAIELWADFFGRLHKHLNAKVGVQQRKLNGRSDLGVYYQAVVAALGEFTPVVK